MRFGENFEIGAGVKTLALGAMALLAAACATATPYQPAESSRGFGFAEQRIENNKFRITFRGNSSTPRDTVENSLLFRAAELTLQQGFDYFVVQESDTEARTTITGSSYPAFYGRYGYGYPFYRPYYGFPYYAYGFGWGRGYDTSLREVTRYSAVAFVSMFPGPKPADDARAFDAREVIDNLRPVVLGDPR